MTKKRDTRSGRRRARRRAPSATAEARLQAVISDLEGSDAPGDPRHHAAIRALVLDGPFVVNETVRRVLDEPHPLASLWRAEFVAFLRTLIRSPGQLTGHPLTTTPGGQFGFTAGVLNPEMAPDHVAVVIDAYGAGEQLRDIALLNLMCRLQEVGVRQVRKCAAPECPHLFVKTYRREYCGVRCQQRHSKQLKRAHDVAHQHQQRERRRRVARSARR